MLGGLQQLSEESISGSITKGISSSSSSSSFGFSPNTLLHFLFVVFYFSLFFLLVLLVPCSSSSSSSSSFHLSKVNLCKVWRMSRQLPPSPLIEETCVRHLSTNFALISLSNSFLKYDKQLLQLALSSGEIEMDMDELTDAILKWGMAKIYQEETQVVSLPFEGSSSSGSSSSLSSLEEEVEEEDLMDAFMLEEESLDTESEEEEEEEVEEDEIPKLSTDTKRVRALVMDLLPPHLLFNRQVKRTVLGVSPSASSYSPYSLPAWFLA
jgi:hypothetical protein